MDGLTALNDRQRQAATTTEGYLRVIAGAGSGKTKLLVSRYAFLVKACGVNPANILCVTFTNKAAGEMRKRICALIGEEYDTNLICTYHGFCVRVLRDNADKIFLPKGFQILDTAGQKEILSDIYQRRELKLDSGSYEKAIKDIALYKAKNLSYVNDFCTPSVPTPLSQTNGEDDLTITQEFLQRQKQLYALDFDDLMFFTLYLFDKFPEVAEFWQDKLNYVQVDEFQDSSCTEMALIEIITAKHKNLMIVGDPDQNIYEWRGSKVELLVDFDKSHLPTNTIFLNQNYRSTPQILKCANTLIDNNELRLKKDLFTLSPAGAPVYHYHLKSEPEEGEKIIEIINSLVKNEGFRHSDCAVLYRSGYLSRTIEKALTQHGVPYEIYGGVKFFKRMEIQDIVAYLRLVAFDDDASFKRIINTPRRRFGRQKLQRLLSLQREGSLFNTLATNLDDATLRNSGAKDFVNLIVSLRKYATTAPLSETIRRICSDSGYENYVRELGNMERFDNLSEFQRISYEYEKSFGEKVSLDEFVNHLTLQAETLDEGDNDTVKLMTIHAAKGLEFPCVFIIGLSDGIFPSSKTIEERQNLGLEEERRLCYVAITRAMKRLFLFDSQGFTQSGNQKTPSRFLYEIGEENYIRIGKLPERISPNERRTLQSSHDKVTVGEMVIHPVFGEGKVLSVAPNGNSAQVQFYQLSSTRNLSTDYIVSLKNGYNPLAEVNEPSQASPSCNQCNSVDNEPSADHSLSIPDENPLVDRTLFTTDDKIDDKRSAFTAKKNPSTTKNDTQTDHFNGCEPTVDNSIVDAIDEKINCDLTCDEDDDEDITLFVPKDNERGKNENADEREKNDRKKPARWWDYPEFPQTGWTCIGVSDLGAPSLVCELCQRQTVRFVHHMYNENYGYLDVGCVCAGKLEGNIENAKQRERNFKRSQALRRTAAKSRWRKSANNNPYKKIDGKLIVLYYDKKRRTWQYSIDGKFSKETFSTQEQCAFAAVDKL